MRRIYVASSWRNDYQPTVIDILRSIGHEVYDFRNPPNRTGFAWSQVGLNPELCTTEQYRQALEHPVAHAGFHSDFDGMKWADTCVMVLPCGRSANTEAGWMKGAGKEVFVFSPIRQEPELMYKLYDGILASFEELRQRFSPAAPCIPVADLLALGFVESNTEPGLYVYGNHELRFREKDGRAHMYQMHGRTIVAHGAAENIEQVQHMLRTPCTNYELPSRSGRFA